MVSKPRAPRRQHDVPEMLLKRFTNDDGKFYVFDKSKPEKGIQYVTPYGAFWEPHFYTSRTADGEKDTSLESYYSKLESDTDPIIEKIVCAVRNSEKPNLTEEEKQKWDRFFWSNIGAHPTIYKNLI